MAALPSAKAAERRRLFIEAEAALGHDRERARVLFERAAAQAPHVTLGHRRLAQFAWADGRVVEAAFHFDFALLTPSTPISAAEAGDVTPYRIARVGRRVDIYRFRGELLVVRRPADFVGITVVRGRPIVLRERRAIGNGARSTAVPWSWPCGDASAAVR